MADVIMLARCLFSQQSPRSLGFPSVFAMTDADRGGDPLNQAMRLQPGDAIILRHYQSAERKTLAERLSRHCRRHGIYLLIAADEKLAHQVKADGLHIPSWGWPSTATKRLAFRRFGFLVTSVHNRAELRQALAFGVDGIIVSPVFKTQSHPLAPPLGVMRIGGITRMLSANKGARRGPLVIGLGGISSRSTRRLAGTTVQAIAGVSLC